MSRLSELISEFEPKPTQKQLDFIKVIEDELLVAFIGTSRKDASDFISEWSCCLSKPVYNNTYNTYASAYENYDEMDIFMATSGFDTIDFY